MKNVYVKYNPFTLVTEITIDGNKINENSALSKVCENHRLQEWIEPHGSKEDFFTVLRRTINEKKVKIYFHGTTLDFEDLQYGKEHYGKVFDEIELVHKVQSPSGAEKIEKIKLLYKMLMDGPVDEIKSESVQNAFKDAINPEFQIVIVAPMSSGKSTLINAMLEEDLLPAINQATTAKITRIKDNDDAKYFRVSAKGKKEVKSQIATLGLINELNKDPDIFEIYIEGNIPSVESNKIKLVFIDTPGGNNSQDSSHGDIMRQVINGENNSVILYVFNGSTPTTKDGNDILRMIASAMERSTNGKQSRDRFLFVANQMDTVNLDNESYPSMVETIKNELGSDEIRIVDPNLFLVSAEAAKLLRLSKKNRTLNSDDSINLMTLKMKFNDSRRMLTEYASIRESGKEILTEEANENIVNINESILPNNKVRAERAAEINSGVPALEYAIREYLDKYAIAIKVKSAHDSFMRKANIIKMTADYEEQCALTIEKFEKNAKELEEKRNDLEKSKKQQEFSKKVDKLRFDNTNVLNIQAALMEKIQGLNENGNLVDKEKAINIIEDIKKYNQKLIEELGKVIDREINNNVVKMCEEIVQQYKDYIVELDKDGMLKFGKFDITQTEAFGELSVKSKETQAMENYIEVINEKVGEKPYEKSGLFNAIRRFFGSEEGWGIEEIFEDVPYVKIDDLIKTQISEIRSEVNNVIRETLKAAIAQIDVVKVFTKKQLSEIDRIVIKQIKELQTKTKNLEELQKQVEINKQHLNWIKEFKNYMEDILEV